MTGDQYRWLLLKQSEAGRFPCVDDTGLVRYRHGGRACAVGVLVPPARYDRRNEGFRASDLFGPGGPWADLLPAGLTAVDLDDVQRVHDLLADDWDHGEFLEALASLECFNREG